MIKHLIIFSFSLLLLLGSGPIANAQNIPTGVPENSTEAEDGNEMDKITKEDTAGKDIKPRTMVVVPDWVEQNYRFRTLTDVSIARIPYFDEVNRVDGFVQTLGQIGKPYQRYRYGGIAEFYRTGNFQNLATGQEDVYILNPEKQILYHDSRTPYVNVNYAQGKQELASLEITVSQNVHPLVNFTLHYLRRQAEGPYLEAVTDHYNAYLSANAHSPDERYIVFAHGAFSELADEINGGVAQLYNYDDLFGKGSQPVSLSDARLKKRYRDLYVQQFFRLTNDTMSTPHRLTLFNSVLRDEQFQQFTDAGISTSLASFQFPVYPTYDSLTFYERALMRRWKAKEGIGYRFSSSILEMNHRGGLENERLTFVQPQFDTVLTRFSPWVEGSLTISPKNLTLDIGYEFKSTRSNLFDAATYASLEANIGIGKYRENYRKVIPGYKLGGADSLAQIVQHRPVSLFGSALVHDRNPSMQNAYWTASDGNSFRSDPTLKNQTFQHAKIGFALWGKDRKGEQRIQPGNLLSFAGFISQTSRMIWYDSNMVISQLDPGQNMGWRGVEGKMRLHFGSFTVENTTILQQPFSQLNDSLASYFHESQPWLYGRAGFYYENQDLKIASIIRAGIECYYNVGYKGWLFDPASQQFYPQNEFSLPAYPRIDLLFSTQIKRAYIFFRIINVNEGFPQVGYFSTPFYPMMDRTFSLGVNWTFFD